MKVVNQQIQHILNLIAFGRNKVVFSIVILLNSIIVIGQRDLTPKSRGEAFGARDFRDLRNYGPQISFGPTYQLTHLKNETIHTKSSHNLPTDYVIDPKGSLGVFFDIGTAHFPTKPPKFLLFGNRLVSYYDWGIGFKLFGGKETTDVTNFDGSGNVLSTSKGIGRFYNGYISGRFTAHKNIHLGKKYFIDNGLGVNFDYRVLSGDQTYYGFISPQYAHKPLVIQLHYDLGLGIRLKRGSYLIPAIQIPIFGIVEMHKGSPALKWYSSNYFPILFKVKFIKILEKKKSTGCNTGSEEDRKRNKEYMQGQ